MFSNKVRSLNSGSDSNSDLAPSPRTMVLWAPIAIIAPIAAQFVTNLAKLVAVSATLCGLCGLFFSPVCQAKEMVHRLGIGGSRPFASAVDLQAFQANYYMDREIMLHGALGFDTEKDNSHIGLQAGFRRVIHYENNLNFFVGGKLSLVSMEIAGSNHSGYELIATTGCEFFFQGLENLGFTFEAGAGIVAVNHSKIATMANSPVSAGIIFYF